MSEREQRAIAWAALFWVVVGCVCLCGILQWSAIVPGNRPPLEHVGHVEPRSPHWHKFRADYLKDHPKCEVCGATEGLEVHHVIPFHDNPALELDTTNVVVLCGHTTKYNHHLWFGHLGDYKCSNPHVREWIKAVQSRKEK